MKNMNKKTSRKTAKKPSVSITSESKEFDNVESLGVLNNPKERKRLDGIDERIKFLKTELKSLLGDMKKDKNSDSFADKSNSVSTLRLDEKIPEDLETNIKSTENWKSPKEPQKSEFGEFKPTFNSTPSKFSAWLDKTIDEMEAKSENEKPNVLPLPPRSEAKITLASGTLAPDSLLFSFRSSSMPLITQESVEQLLYKSFLLQNSEVPLSGSEISDPEPGRSISKTREQKFKKSKKPHKTISKGRPIQNTFRPCSRYPRMGNDRRLSNLSPPHSSAEIIDLDNGSDTKKIPEKSAIYVDLDVSDYDWSEPFDINKETHETHSDVQVLECYRGKSDYSNNKELQLNSSEVTESDSSVFHNEGDGIRPKKIWECPVCFERSKGQEIVATQCGHVFCRKCLEDHISKLSNNCPSCRCDLRHKPFITLFNF